MGPTQLAQVLRDLKIPSDERLIVGLATGDDAGVYRVADGLAIVQTVDFFTPIVDDPYIWGQIAAANSLSDVYAMGARPITAMNLLCYPIASRDINEVGAILRGGSEKMAEARVTLVGGHSVLDPEPKYGLAVTGLVDPDQIATNAGAQDGDVVILTKPLGTGVIATAAKFDACNEATLASACASMVKLNAGAAEAMRTVGINADGVHAATDVTGFGLLGHLYRVAMASGVSVELTDNAIPVLPGAEALAAENLPKGGHDNALYVGENAVFAQDISVARRNILFDPQTSGGLLIFVAEGRTDDLLAALDHQGVETRAVIGRATIGAPVITVT